MLSMAVASKASSPKVVLTCPVCGSDLGSICALESCSNCGRKFSTDDGVPLLFWENDWAADKPDVTSAMQAFYEQTPFPNYDEFDSSSALPEKARRGVFAKLLDEQIPHGSNVLEAGCGTGQLSNFLGTTWGRQVYGT